MYKDVLRRLGIEGATESDRFRSLIEYMYDYLEVNLPVPVERSEKVEGELRDRSRLDVLDLIIQSLKDHEVSLDRIATKLEKATVPGIQ